MHRFKIDKNNALPVAVTAVIVAVIAFYGGMKYEQLGAASARQQFQQMRGQRSGAFQSSGGLISGQVVSKDADSITVKTMNGSSRIILYSNSTSFNKPVPGSIDDISTGTEITAVGTQNSDGIVTAQSIQVREGGQGR